MRKLFLASFAIGALIVHGDTGIRPRASASDYPTRQNGEGVTLAAGVVSPEQVKKLFSTDLTKLGYMVVELAVYPDPDKNIEIAGRDFMLRVTPEGTTIRAVKASVIAGQLHKKEPASSTPSAPAKLPGNVAVYPTATVGYETGTYNGRRTSGVYTGAGVGVGVGGPTVDSTPPPAPGGTKKPDSLSVQVELEERALPEGQAHEPIAGYLYFPKPELKKKSSLDLTWYGPAGQIRLALPPAK
jgi:hypothetical protein